MSIPATGAETGLLTVTQRDRTVSLDDVLGRLSDHRAVLLVNERSGRAAIQIPAPSFMLDDGEIERRVRSDPSYGAAQRPVADDDGKLLGRSRP
jgi:hypothetical protein